MKSINVRDHIKVHFKIVGCLPIVDTNQTFNSIHIASIFVVLILYAVSSLWFLVFEEKVSIDLMESIFWAIRSIQALALYLMLIWYRADLNRFIDNLHELVNNRKCFDKSVSV